MTFSQCFMLTGWQYLKDFLFLLDKYFLKIVFHRAMIYWGTITKLFKTKSHMYPCLLKSHMYPCLLKSHMYPCLLKRIFQYWTSFKLDSLDEQCTVKTSRRSSYESWKISHQYWIPSLFTMSSRFLPVRVKFTNGLIVVKEVENNKFQLNYVAANGLTINFKL